MKSLIFHVTFAHANLHTFILWACRHRPEIPTNLTIVLVIAGHGHVIGWRSTLKIALELERCRAQTPMHKL